MPYEPINLGLNQHLGYGRGPDGGLVGLIFENGTNTLVTHAVWAEVDRTNYRVHQEQPTEPHRLTPSSRSSSTLSPSS